MAHVWHTLGYIITLICPCQGMFSLDEKVIGMSKTAFVHPDPEYPNQRPRIRQRAQKNARRSIRSIIGNNAAFGIPCIVPIARKYSTA